MRGAAHFHPVAAHVGRLQPRGEYFHVNWSGMGGRVSRLRRNALAHRTVFTPSDFNKGALRRQCSSSLPPSFSALSSRSAAEGSACVLAHRQTVRGHRNRSVCALRKRAGVSDHRRGIDAWVKQQIPPPRYGMTHSKGGGDVTGPCNPKTNPDTRASAPRSSGGRRSGCRDCSGYAERSPGGSPRRGRSPSAA